MEGQSHPAIDDMVEIRQQFQQVAGVMTPETQDPIGKVERPKVEDAQEVYVFLSEGR